MRQREAGPGTARARQEGAEHRPVGMVFEVGDCKVRQGQRTSQEVLPAPVSEESS